MKFLNEEERNIWTNIVCNSVTYDNSGVSIAIDKADYIIGERRNREPEDAPQVQK